MDTSEARGVPAGIPTFRGIATAPGQSKDRIVGTLLQPHPPMPNIQLSRADIEDLVAYLDALRAEQSLPPLQPPTGLPKPIPPAKT